MIWTFVGIGGLALVMMFFGNSEYREQRSLAAQVSLQQLELASTSITIADFRELFSFLTSKSAVFLAPMFALQGMTGALNAGVVPSLIGHNDGGPPTLTLYFLMHAISATIAAVHLAPL